VTQLIDNFRVLVATEESFYSFDCLLIYFGLTQVPTIFIRVFMIGLIPIGLIILSIPVWFVKQCYDDRKPKPISKKNSSASENPSLHTEDSFKWHMNKRQFKMKHKLITTSFVIIMLFLPTILTNSFSMFLCTPYQGSTYLKKDTSV
jgi:hypothetical protein